MLEAEAFAYLAMMNDCWPGDIGPLAERAYVDLLCEFDAADAAVAMNKLIRKFEFRPSIAAVETALNRERDDAALEVPVLPPPPELDEAQRQEVAAMLHEFRESRRAV